MFTNKCWLIKWWHGSCISQVTVSALAKTVHSRMTTLTKNWKCTICYVLQQ